MNPPLGRDALGIKMDMQNTRFDQQDDQAVAYAQNLTKGPRVGWRDFLPSIQEARDRMKTGSTDLDVGDFLELSHFYSLGSENQQASDTQSNIGDYRAYTQEAAQFWDAATTPEALEKVTRSIGQRINELTPQTEQVEKAYILEDIEDTLNIFEHAIQNGSNNYSVFSYLKDISQTPNQLCFSKKEYDTSEERTLRQLKARALNLAFDSLDIWNETGDTDKIRQLVSEYIFHSHDSLGFEQVLTDLQQTYLFPQGVTTHEQRAQDTRTLPRLMGYYDAIQTLSHVDSISPSRFVIINQILEDEETANLRETISSATSVQATEETAESIQTKYENSCNAIDRAIEYSTRTNNTKWLADNNQTDLEDFPFDTLDQSVKEDFHHLTTHQALLFAKVFSLPGIRPWDRGAQEATTNHYAQYAEAFWRKCGEESKIARFRDDIEGVLEPLITDQVNALDTRTKRANMQVLKDEIALLGQVVRLQPEGNIALALVNPFANVLDLTESTLLTTGAFADVDNNILAKELIELKGSALQYSVTVAEHQPRGITEWDAEAIYTRYLNSIKDSENLDEYIEIMSRTINDAQSSQELRPKIVGMLNAIRNIGYNTPDRYLTLKIRELVIQTAKGEASPITRIIRELDNEHVVEKLYIQTHQELATAIADHISGMPKKEQQKILRQE